MKKFLSIVFCTLLLFALAVPAFAAPSVQQQGIPKVVSPNQNNVRNNVATEEKEELQMVPAFDIPEDSTNPEDIEFREAYEKAQSMDLGTFIVRDVFDVRGEIEKGVNDVITFDVSSYGDKVAVYEYIDGQWSEISKDRISRYSDGTMAVTLIDACPLAIAVDTAEDAPNVAPAPVAEEECCDHWYCNSFCCNLMNCTPDNCNCWIIYVSAVAVIAVIVALVILIAVKKNKK